MPRLLLFAPCEKAIIDVETNVVSLISVVGDVAVNFSEPTEIVPQTALPMQWTALAVWRAEEGDDKATFESQVELIDPIGKVVLALVTDFQLKKTNHRIANRFSVFPIGRTGDYLLRLLLRRKPEVEWSLITEYPIRVSYGNNARMADVPEAVEA